MGRVSHTVELRTKYFFILLHGVEQEKMVAMKVAGVGMAEGVVEVEVEGVNLPYHPVNCRPPRGV